MWEVIGIAVAKNKDEHVALVATAGSEGNPNRDAVWHLRELGSTAWSQLGEPPGGMTEFTGQSARPSIAANADGRFEVVTIGRDKGAGKVWHVWQKAPNGDWSEWKSLDPPHGVHQVDPHPVLARNKDGRLGLFVTADDRAAVWHSWQEQAGSDGWAKWQSLKKPAQVSSFIGQPALGQNKNGHLELFMTAADDGAVWHKWQNPAAPDGWSDWQSFHPPSAHVKASGAPAVAQHVDGRLDVFVTADDRAVWHKCKDPAAPDGWARWESLSRQGAGHFTEVAAVARPTGPLVLFAVGASTQSGVPDQLWSREQAGPANAWQPWRERTGPLRAGGLPPGALGGPTLALLPEPDAVVVVLFLQILGEVSLHRLRSPSPEAWIVDPMRLQPPPEATDDDPTPPV